MEINPNIRSAAQALIKSGDVKAEPVELTDYPGMFVANADNSNLQAFMFLEENGVAYAVGPVRRADK